MIKIYNFIIIFFMVLFIKNANCQSATWEAIGPEGGQIRSIFFDKRDTLIFAGSSSAGLFFSSLKNPEWKSIGYNDLIAEYGRGRFIEVIKKINNSLYVCSDWGLLKSDNGGNNWENIFQSINGFASSVEIYPSEPNLIYLSFYGGGQGYFSNPGIYKSIDYGKTWYAINNGLISTDINQLVMSANNKHRLYASTLKGIFRTDDGGESGWINISGNLPAIPFTALAIDSLNEQIIYAGSYNGLFKTEDGGNHWENISSDAYFESNFINLKALALKDSILLVGTMKGLYISKDGGQSWYEANSGLENLCIYAVCIMDSQNFLVATADGIYKKVNGETEWHKISNGLNAFQTLSLDFAKIDNEESIFIGTAGAGIINSHDKGETWENLNVLDGFLYVEDIAVFKKEPMYIYAGFIGNYDPQRYFVENGILRTENLGENWDLLTRDIADKFITSIAIDPNDKNILYAGTLQGIYKSIDAGNSWIRSDSGRVGHEQIGVIAIDQFSNQTIYAGTIGGGNITEPHGIFKSNDGGNSWEFSSAGLPISQFFMVWDLAINPCNPKCIFAVLFGRGIFKSSNAGGWWQQVGNNLDNNRLYSIAIDPSDTNIVYAAGEKIFLSTDAGNTWEEIMQGVPEHFGYVNEIRIDLDDPRYVYAATYGSGVLRLFRPNSGVNEDVQIIPETFALKQNYPNPFNPETRIEYSVAMSERILLQIFNQRGQLIRTLVNEVQSPGSYMKIWDGKDESGSNVASGIYLYRLQAGKFSETKKMIKLQ